jgi:hypothetical protein
MREAEPARRATGVRWEIPRGVGRAGGWRREALTGGRRSWSVAGAAAGCSGRCSAMLTTSPTGRV